MMNRPRCQSYALVMTLAAMSLFTLVSLTETTASAQSAAADRTTSQHVVVILDDSGSMKKPMGSNRRMSRMDAAKQSLITVIESLPPDAQVGIVGLNNRWIYPLGPINKAEATMAIHGIRAKGGTPLGAYMKYGADELLRSRSNDRYGSYRLLIVTDGEAGDQEAVESFLPDILSRGITTDVIGVDMAEQHSLATKVDTYRRADDPESLTRAVREVFAETSADAGDAGEDDFDLVAGLPDKVALAALEALGSAGNHPIGSEASILNNGPAPHAAPAQQPNLPGPPGGVLFPQNQQQQPRAQDEGGPSIFALLIIGFVLFNLAKAFFGGGRRQHR